MHRLISGIVAVSGCLLLVALASSPAMAAIDLVTFSETPTNTTLTVSGANLDLPIFKSVNNGVAFWNVSATFTQTGPNQISVQGTAQHTAGPHIDDQQGGLFSSFSGVLSPTAVTLTPSVPTTITGHPNNHFDIYQLSGSVTTAPGNPNLVTGWTFVVNGSHAEGQNVIPEPTTMAVWSVLGMAGLGAGWWRRRKS